MHKLYILLTIMLISFSTNAEINTQYPGWTPYGSTSTEVDTRPKYFYPIQKPLNNEALEAMKALKDQK